MRGPRGSGTAAVVLAVVSVALAAGGHALGHGRALDASSALVAAAVAAGLGALVAPRWTLARLLLVLVAVQVLVHLLAGYAGDPRLVAAAGRGHAHDIVAGDSSTASLPMLVWHLLAVPATALLLAALARSSALVSALLRRLLLARPVHLPALAPAGVPGRRPRPGARRPHLVVSWSNAPPCQA